MYSALRTVQNKAVQDRPRLGLIVFLGFILLIAAIFTYIQTLNRPPANFPVQETIVIDEGETISSIAETLRERDFVRSSIYLMHVLKYDHFEAPVQAGRYAFDEPLTTEAIAAAITSGEYSTPAVSITFPEGLRGERMKPIIESELPDLTVDVDTLDEHIGYLFPDTYYVSTETTLSQLIETMRENFDHKTAPLNIEANTHDLTAHEVIILASIVEREADTMQSKRTVAGILLKRLDADMPLQVDAAFEYLLGKTSAELTVEDLALDSPYNTYVYRGLPPTPIANPGVDSIQAVLDPNETPYLYYLTGADGHFYYAETFEEHVGNKRRYLQ